MNKIRPFLKWAGGKFLLAEKINKLLPQAECLVEPFVGAGAVFLNSHKFERYQLNDINPDLINLYLLLQSQPEILIKESAKLFADNQHNSEQRYYELRDEFNQSQDKLERSSLFIYLNRHGYNGLCRYNRTGLYNVPFGRYKKPYFPEWEMHAFAEKAQQAVFSCVDFQQAIKAAPDNSVIYCDPPYASLSNKPAPSFTGYAASAFNDEHQQILGDLAATSRDDRQISVLVSNHDTKLTRKIYKPATRRRYFQVGRYISRKGQDRKPVKEVFALYKA
ncbi:DNA adenine methylase [Saccharobesus litoralis]|uniref:Site-specific DNA-methyltransferase (adenine-specific) n=1 Tax=Saccharobesus litoralis TaxID=2172099 RepID=A0A2S0VQJ9_9ALTE|nr:Dam family site-specific DNA-(adenine-N6)-methyltransferase [Saccharobesus litoralis]AWB66495.1 DNA adenine methylase [Saccharobesus litoralis]